MNICSLCKLEKELQESHIIPGFLFRWLRKTSPTGYVRMTSEPNRRRQDGLKMYLLCRDCEQLFSTYETKFARSVFYPFVNDGKRNFPYESWMLKFCVSLTWRALKYYEINNHLREFGKPFLEISEKAEFLWRRYLLAESDSPDTDLDHHIYFMDSLEEVSEDDHPFVNRYLQRVIDMDVVTVDVEPFVTVKFPYFSLVGFIGSRPDEQTWLGGKLGQHAALLTGEYSIPRYYWDYILEKCEVSHSMFDGVSKKQWNKINKARLENQNNPNMHASHKAVQDDIRLFGSRASRKN